MKPTVNEIKIYILRKTNTKLLRDNIIRNKLISSRNMKGTSTLQDNTARTYVVGKTMQRRAWCRGRRG